MQVGAIKSSMAMRIYAQNAQKASFETYIASIMQERIEDEKRKKAGGGGSMRRPDKIKSSFMFANYLSNKTIQAMMRNFNGQERADRNQYVQTQAPIIVKFINKVATNIMSFVRAFSAPIIQNVFQMFNSIKKLNNQMLQFAQNFSLQFHKLKELLENEIIEKMKWKQIKSKLAKASGVLEDFIVSMKEEVKDLLLNLKLHIKLYQFEGI